MTFPKIRSLLIPLLSFCIVLGVSAAVIAYGRGYRVDVRQTSLKPTGLVSATSDPIGAQVLVDTKLKTATNNSFAIDPGWYTVRIIKEGYIPWEKKTRVQGEVVTRADAFLFPTSPSLSPLTTIGLEHPVLSPDGTKIAYTIPLSTTTDGGVAKAGVWIYELADRPLGRNRDPQLLAASTPIFDFSPASVVWSPDSSEIMALTATRARTYTIGKTDVFEDVTSGRQTVLDQWQKDDIAKNRQKLAAFKEGFVDVATSSAKILSFSPDETKILYEATAAATIPHVIDPALIGTNSTEEDRSISPGRLYVYDSREDRNYFLFDKKELPKGPAAPLPTPGRKNQLELPDYALPTPLRWFPTSKHLILTYPEKIDVLEFDRTNWTTIYAGPFADSFLAPWPSGSRLVILTSLNPSPGTLPNLYTVNLR